MMVEEMAKKIEDHVKEYKHVSFVEIMRLFGQEAKGDYCMEILPNCILWSGMSMELVDAINDCLIRGTIVPKGTSLMVYFVDGMFPKWPLAKRLPKNGFKTPHWVPVVFNPPGEKLNARKTN